jgi:hypothetical protein
MEKPRHGQNVAKHEIMKKNSVPRLVRLPAYPHTGREILLRVRGALAEIGGAPPSFARLGGMMGQGENTTHYWFHAFAHPHILGLFSLLERVPKRKRQEILDRLFRDLPDFDHPRLAHNPVAITSLKRLIDLPANLVILRGGTDYQRTFVATAMAHAYLQCGKSRIVAGIDVNEPRTWVPVESVIYFEQLQSPQLLRQGIAAVWPQIIGTKAGMIMLNGVWSLNPELHRPILELARTRLVVLADQNLPEATTQFPGARYLVTVTATREDADAPLRITLTGP